MPYEFKFIDDPHVSIVSFSGTVTQDEAIAESQLSLEALERCTGKYYSVVDVTGKPTFAFNALKIPEITQVIRHPNFGWGIIVGVSPLANFWFEILGRTIGLKFKVFQNMDDGLTFIEGLRRLEREAAQSQPPAE
jgi:hypothetical protein